MPFLDYFHTNYFRNLTARTVMNVVSKTTGLIITILLARYLGPTQLGYFSFVVSLAGTFSLVFALGLPGYVQRHIPARLARGDEIGARSLARTAYRLALLSSAVLVILAPLLGYVVLTAFHRTSAPLLFALAGIYAAAAVFSFLGDAILTALHRLRFALSYSILRDVLRLILVTASVYALHHFVPVVLSYILAFGIYTYITYLLVRSFYGSAPILPFSAVLRSSLPYLFFGLASMLLAYTDVLMLSALRPIAEVGYYKVAQLSAFTIIALLPIVSVSLPTLSRAAERGDLRKKFFLLVFFVLGVSAIVLPILYFVGPYLITFFFGPQYSASIPVFYIFLLFIPVYFVYALGVQAVIAKGREWEQIIYPLLAGALNVVLNYYFIIKMGMLGAAIATTLSMAIAAVLVGARLVLLRGEVRG